MIDQRLSHRVTTYGVVTYTLCYSLHGPRMNLALLRCTTTHDSICSVLMQCTTNMASRDSIGYVLRFIYSSRPKISIPLYNTRTYYRYIRLSSIHAFIPSMRFPCMYILRQYPSSIARNGVEVILLKISRRYKTTCCTLNPIKSEGEEKSIVKKHR